MFLKTTQFKRMLKEKYNSGGIEVFCSDSDTRIAGAYWMIAVKNGKINKENLAAIIEFTGELPKEGTGANISKTQDERVRLLQDDERKIYPIYEDILKLIDPSKIDKNQGETLPDGPFIMKDGAVMWRNNIMALKVYPRRDANYKELVDYIEKFPGGIM